jgi:membrane protease YdiL (CAAX protease family)
MRVPDLTIHETAPPVSGRSVLAVLGLWLALAAVLGGAGWYGASALAPKGATSETPTLVVVFLVYALFPVAALIVYRPVGVRDQLRFGFTRGRDLVLGLLVWLVILVTAVVVYAVIGLVSGSLTGPALAVVRDATDMARIPHADGFDWFLIVVRAVLLAGITEELLFRGVLFGWLRRYLPAWATIVITAVPFTLEHYFPVLFPLVLLYGIGLGWLRERTGSLLPGLIAHLLTDTLLFVAALALLAAHVPA